MNKKVLFLLLFFFSFFPAKVFALKVSIMGDSISTYRGVSYSNEVYPTGDVNEINKTWWGMSFNELGFTLGENISWGSSMFNRNGYYTGDKSDTTRCYFKDKEPNVKTSCFFSDERIIALGKNGNPDIIIIYGGSNDMNSSLTKFGSYSNLTDTSTFIAAFSTLITKIKTRYPNARLFGIIPNRIPKSESNNLTNERWETFYSIYKTVFNYYKIPYADLSTTVLQELYGTDGSLKDHTYFFSDNLHPRYEGMKIIKNEVVKLFNKNVKINFYRNDDKNDTYSKSEVFTLKNANNKISTVYSREGYRLLGWNTNKNATTREYKTNSEVTDWWIFNSESNVNLYAIWEETDSYISIKDTTNMDIEDDLIIIKYPKNVTKVTNEVFIENINTVGEWKLYDKNDSIINNYKSVVLTTGETLKSNSMEYKVVILGDINQDGQITINDLYQDYLLYKNRKNEISDSQRNAADYDRNGLINIKDLYNIYKKIKNR